MTIFNSRTFLPKCSNYALLLLKLDCLIQWRSREFSTRGGVWRGWGGSLQPPGGYYEYGGKDSSRWRQGNLETEPNAERFMRFFNKNNAFFAHFVQISCFKAI